MTARAGQAVYFSNVEAHAIGNGKIYVGQQADKESDYIPSDSAFFLTDAIALACARVPIIVTSEDLTQYEPAYVSDPTLPADSALCYIYTLLESDDYKINGVRLNTPDADLQPVVIDTLVVDSYDGEVATGKQMTIYRISLYVYESYWSSEEIANEHDAVVIYCEFGLKPRPTLITAENYLEYNLSTDYIGYYAIANADELYWFANYVNKGNTEVNAILLNDIVVNENVLDKDGNLNGTPARTWTPIGTEDFSYYGKFDGNGHTISGLYIDDEEADYVGLFGKMYDFSSVKKLGIVDSYFRGNRFVGGICGFAYDAKFDSCYNAGVVKGRDNVGGLFGEVLCSFDNYDGDKNMNNMYVTNCHNEGLVEGDDGYVGGIAGQVGSRIENCYNAGTVIGIYEVGGIGGFIYLNGFVKECYNIGEIKGEDRVGGLAGEMLARNSIINCYNSGNVNSVYVGAGLCCINEGQIVNSYSNGTVTSGERASGICIGNIGNVENCYYDNTKFTGDAILSDEGTSTVYGKSSAQFADGTVATALHNYDNGETGDANINGGFWGQGFSDSSPNYSGEVITSIAIDETNFPDANFRQYVLDEIDTNDDEFLNVSERVATKQIDCSNMEIASLQGIEYLTDVTALNCSDNKLTSVDLSLNTALQSFNCYYNQLTSLDVSANTELTKLICDYNSLTSLDLSKNTNLEYLECSANKIESLDLSNNINLSYFNGYGNKLKSFDLSKNTKLNQMSCDFNQLTSLTVSPEVEYSFYSCADNKYEALEFDAEGGIVMPNVVFEKVSNCSSNVVATKDEATGGTRFTVVDNTVEEFTYTYNIDNTSIPSAYYPIFTIVCPVDDTLYVAIDETNFPDSNFRQEISSSNDLNGDGKLSPYEIRNALGFIMKNKNISSIQGIELFTNLFYLDCSGNNLTSVDLSSNTKLNSILMDNNQLDSIDVSHNTDLVELSMKGNQLTSIDLSQNSNLHNLNLSNNHLTNLDLSNNKSLLGVSVKCEGNTFDMGVIPMDGFVMPNVDVLNVWATAGANPEEVVATDGTLFKPWMEFSTSVSYQYYTGNDAVDPVIFTISFVVGKKLELLVNDEDFGEVAGAGAFVMDSTVEFSATPKGGCHFVKWSDENTDAEREIKMTEDITLTAIFAAHEYGEWDTTTVATCESVGERKHTCSCGHFETEEIPAIGHSYGEPTFAWSVDKKSAIATFACEKSDDSFNSDCEVVIDTVLATCTADGYIKYVATIEYNEKEYGDTINVVLPATGHNYEFAEFVWSDDKTSAIATFACEKSDDSFNSDCEVEIDTVLATCTADGYIKYVATIEYNEKEYGDTINVVLPATGHNYEFAEIVWSDDKTSATATFACVKSDDSVNPDCVVDIDTVLATCTADGYIKYVATVEYDETVYGDTITVVLPATGHNYEFAEIVWSDDKTSAIATFACEKSDDSVNSDCDVEIDTVLAICTADGYIKYVATIEYNEKEYGDTINVVLPATGHNYEFAEFVWSDDKTSAIATFACEKSDDSFNNDCDVEIDTVLATCTADGYIKYVATIEYNEKEYGDTINVVLPATGHNYEFAEIVWSDDKTSAIATFACEKSDDSFNNDCDVNIDTVLATCTADGYIKYVATIEYNEKEYGDTINVVLPATGHNYEFAEIVWSDDKTSATATFACVKSDDSFNSDCEVEIDTVLATCTANGYIKYVATLSSLIGATYGDTIIVALPAKGHVFGEPTFAWTEYSAATATFVCEKEDATEIVDGVITSDTTVAPTAEAEGLLVYTATFTFNGETYTDTKEEILDKLPFTAVDDVQSNQVKVWGYNRIVYIENAEGVAQVFDVSGRLVKSAEINDAHIEIPMERSGVYIVVVEGKSYQIFN